MISSPDHAHKIPLTTQSCDSQLFDTPVMHVQDNIHVPFHGSKKKLDPAQGTFPGSALVISMRLQTSPRKRVVAYGQHAKWIVFAPPFTIVISLPLDMLAPHSHGPETTLLKVVFISS